MTKEAADVSDDVLDEQIYRQSSQLGYAMEIANTLHSDEWYIATSKLQSQRILRKRVSRICGSHGDNDSEDARSCHEDEARNSFNESHHHRDSVLSSSNLYCRK